MAKRKGGRPGRTPAQVQGKARGKGKGKGKQVQLDLDMADHATRLRAIPSSSQDVVRQTLLWIAAGVLLIALGWMAIGR